MHVFFLLTLFGDPFITGPLAVAVLAWFAAIGYRRAALYWALSFAGGVGLVALTKFVYSGWGIGIAAWRFTGISGHTMLSASVYPLVALVCARGKMGMRFAIVAGFAFAFSIGVSRVVLGFHSWSEILSGWMVGASAAVFTVSRMRRADERELDEPTSAERRASQSAGLRASWMSESTAGVTRSTAAFAAVACIIAVLSYGRSVPVSAWISHVAPKVAEWSRGWLDVRADAGA
ncbi:phosphatase PAP2 family protein [Burkholderia sp. TSV86]|uniref:phosphatase PAP2 family protein n=1 Tax=Burkholderia sp. TSV86 TaxID=1385594 RepID=UPI00075EE273|nr:phosphatase PAP2 family protein [Burkholderia sp. TSV86]KVE38726.1 phosphoesterase [Burkholderia sp. TSV86]